MKSKIQKILDSYVVPKLKEKWEIDFIVELRGISTQPDPYNNIKVFYIKITSSNPESYKIIKTPEFRKYFFNLFNNIMEAFGVERNNVYIKINQPIRDRLDEQNTYGKSFKSIFTNLIQKLIKPKLEELGFDSISIVGIKYPDDRIGEIYIKTEPPTRKIYNQRTMGERKIEKYIEDKVSDILEVMNVDPWDWEININKKNMGKIDENKLPFKEKINGNKRLRKFSETVDEGELQWHRDREDRIVIPTHQTDWKVQLDNELPISLVEGEQIEIPKGVYHRLIKGTGDLNLTVIFK